MLLIQHHDIFRYWICRRMDGFLGISVPSGVFPSVEELVSSFKWLYKRGDIIKWMQLWSWQIQAGSQGVFSGADP